MGLGLGTIFYVALLLINAIAVLNEERFLARSEYPPQWLDLVAANIFWCTKVGWSSLQPAQQFNAQYDNTGFGDQGGPGVKSRLINLISAVRTLLRSESVALIVYIGAERSSVPLIVVNIVVILYELVLG